MGTDDSERRHAAAGQVEPSISGRGRVCVAFGLDGGIVGTGGLLRAVRATASELPTRPDVTHPGEFPRILARLIGVTRFNWTKHPHRTERRCPGRGRRGRRTSAL